MRGPAEAADTGASDAYPVASVTFSEALLTFAKVGLLSFGGPAGQIALMHRVLVEEKRWISETRFLHALNYCMLLPGPEAMQLATYVGWLMHGVRGGVMAGLLFVLPGLALIIALALLYVLFGEVPAMQAIFFGLKAAVLALIVQALLRLSKRALKTPRHWLFAIGAFVALFAFGVPFPLVILAAGLAGWLIHALARPQDLPAHAPNEALPQPDSRPLRTVLIWGGLWALPVIVLVLTLGAQHRLTELSLFFSKMAVVTFGGAYAVLSYVAQAAVSDFHWLSATQMIDGLALAETTPGPLILVLVFTGFLAGTTAAAPFTPLLAGLLAAFITAWVTFVPCFLWIFLGAPYIEKLRHNQALAAALGAITAAVVGVIAQLALWFAFKTLFARSFPVMLWPLHLELPVPSSLNLPFMALSLLALLLMLRGLGLFAILGLCSVLGLVLSALFGS